MNGRGLVLLLALGQFLAMADRNLFAVAAPDAARMLGIADGTLGFILGTAFALGYGLAVAPLGRWGDDGRRRAMIVGGLALWTAGSAATAVAQGPAGLIAARIVLGIGQAAFVPAALAVLVDGPAAARPWRLAAFTSGSTLGRSVALLAGGAILTMLAPAHWRWLFAITAAPNLVLAAMLWTRIRERPALSTERVKLATPPLTLVLYLVAAIAPLVVGQAATAWMPSLLVRSLSQTAGGAGVTVGATTLLAAPAGQLLGGWLARRSRVMRERPATVIAAAQWLALPGFLLLALAPTTATIVGAIAWINIVLGVATFAGLFGWQELTPAAARGTANGVFMAVTLLAGAGLGPLLTGVLSQAGHGLAPALTVTAAVGAVVASVGAAAMGLRARRVGQPA